MKLSKLSTAIWSTPSHLSSGAIGLLVRMIWAKMRKRSGRLSMMIMIPSCDATQNKIKPSSRSRLSSGRSARKNARK